ncbi:hypothetical protein [Pectobacterium sp. A5351]|uniref:hypothetical protein n=1 Tax=Pectobacterium sp. A5351 TaxID=2914983 RepID=UPI00232D1F35|nr:hypothetical protein [Pectobacterium sp. A5351]WCG82540.1 hypothetical protein O1Q74_16850 [Pectobacterium sp. A5351]
MTKPKQTSPFTDEALEKLSPAELRTELCYLRAENAYLKKLKALVQREKNGISKRRREYSLSDLLRTAGMSRSTWYHNMNALKRADKHAELKNKISEMGLRCIKSQ